MKKSDIENFIKAAENPNYISGIYNYCDGWCERCQHTAKCFSYNSNLFNKKKSDINNDEFWDTLSSIFSKTKELILHVSKKQGIDLNDITDEEITEQKHEYDKIRKTAKKKKYVILADKYSKIAVKWFDSSDKLFLKKEKELNKFIELELPNTDPIKIANQITNFTEIISWYHLFIYIKLQRATEGLIQYQNDNTEVWAMDDANATSKLVIVSIERSINAWLGLMELFKEEEDAILDILVVLQKIQKAVEKDFPNARKYIRPGLDEI